MFENIGHFFKRMVKTEQQKELGSKDAAKERLHLVLMQDRANVSADFLELMKQEIIDVIKKYIVVDEDSIDVRLTNQSNDDGTNGAPALYANIPIVNIKNDMMAEKIKSFEGVDFNKEMGILVEQEDKQEQTNSVENNPENTELNTPKVIELSSPVEDISKTEEQNTDIKEEKVLTEEEPEEVKEMFEEVYEDDEDDDVTFDDLLKAAEAADKELKEKQEQENEAKKESTSTEKPKTTKSGKSSTKTTKSKQKRK